MMDERLAVFEAMRRFYDVRSKIVHGSDLRPAERAIVDDDSDLRAIVRRFVRAVIFATVHSGLMLTDSYIDEQVDRALLNTQAHQELREALGLE